MSAEVKKEILRLLRVDEEFRYAVAGLIGLEDIRKGQDELRLGLARLEEAQARLEQAHARLEEAVARLQEAMARLQEAVARLQEAVASLASEQRRTSRTLRHLIRYINSMSITLEEEAHSIIERRLSQRGIFVRLGALVRPYVELDVYGSDGSLTFLGETKTRLAVRHVKRLEKKIEMVKMREPELLRGRVVLTIYAMWVHPDAYEECKVRNIWLNMPNKELIELEQAISKA